MSTQKENGYLVVKNRNLSILSSDSDIGKGSITGDGPYRLRLPVSETKTMSVELHDETGLSTPAREARYLESLVVSTLYS